MRVTAGTSMDTTPANDSDRDLRPGITGIAICDVAKSAYMWIMRIASSSASSAVACAVWPSCGRMVCALAVAAKEGDSYKALVDLHRYVESGTTEKG